MHIYVDEVRDHFMPNHFDFAAVALNSDSAAPKNAKVLSKPVHLRELVNEVQKLLAA
jgi:hypothetical protein